MDLCIGMDRQRGFVLIRDQGEEAVKAFLLRHGLLLDRRRQVLLRREEPHLDEPHGLVRQVVDLGVVHAAAYGGVLHPPLFQHTALAALVCVAELAGSAVRYHLDVLMGVQGPHRAGGEGVVVEYAQSAELYVLRITVPVKGKMPPTVERPSLDSALSLINLFRSAYSNHGIPLSWKNQ
jgi:hypothetical protein